MKISEVQITPVEPRNGLVAFASFVIDEALRCSSIAIMTRPNGGYRLLYPTKKSHERNTSIYYPISKAIGDSIEQVVIAKYEDATKEDVNDRYGSPFA